MVAWQAEFLQDKRFVKRVSRDDGVLFNMVPGFGCGRFIIGPKLEVLQPAPILEPHMDSHVINGRALVRFDEGRHLVQAAMDSLGTGANQVVGILGVNEAGGFINPFGKAGNGIIAFIGTRSRFVGQFPCYDGGVIAVDAPIERCCDDG